MPAEVGDRVGAILSAKDDTAKLFGYGVYEGYLTPDPALGITFMGIPLDHPNPCIKLDSGKHVFGCECWWGPEEKVKGMVANYATVVEVDIEQERRRSLRE